MSNVIDNTAAGRFELTEQGETAIAAYVREGDAIVFTHTQVPPALEGQGVGSRLIAGALAQVRDAGLKVVPACSFVAGYVQRHPEAADLA
jgi:predicted GNAT family acetyltransferase